MAFDREDTLKRAEKLLRQGRLEGAIAEYLRVVEEQPLDWNTANMLGDLYVRAAQSDKAVAQYTRIAEHFHREGFYPKAGALYKKILKISPDDERAQLGLAEVSLSQGLLADAKAYFTVVATRRRARGDAAGAEEVVIRLGTIDPGDLEARTAAARALAQRGDVQRAAAHFRAIYDAHVEDGRQAEAFAALREAITLNPGDVEARALFVTEAMRAGELATAREYLSPDAGAGDAAVLARLLEMELREGHLEEGRRTAVRLIGVDGSAARVVDTGWSLATDRPDAALACIEFGVAEAVEASNFAVGAALLQEFAARVPGHIPALLRLVELCVDGGLETTMYDAQAGLADAYLAAGQPGEARVIAEDLLAHEPWDAGHADRLRRALVLCGVEDPDAAIAERLNSAALRDESPIPDLGAPEPALQAADDLPVATPLPALPEARPQPVPDPVPVLAPPAPPNEAADAELISLGAVEVDLTEALAGLQATVAPVPTAPSRPANLEEVFQDMRDVASRDAAASEGAEHMKLGRTFLEMGMTDEALQAFRRAARWPTERFEAALTMARLHTQRGERSRAVEWMERAAQVPAPTADAGRLLLYELGVLLEGSGETARALAVFLELQADAPGYRDIATRVQRLAQVEAGG